MNGWLRMDLLSEPVVIENPALPEDLFFGIHHELSSPVWRMTNISNGAQMNDMEGLLPISFWTSPHSEGGDPVFGKAAYHLKLQLQKKVKSKLYHPDQVGAFHINGQTVGQTGQLHKDDLDPDSKFITCVLFSNNSWSRTWGGELVVSNPSGSNWWKYDYNPNTAVAFPAIWPHFGTDPNRNCSELRTSVAFRYANYDGLV